MRLYVANVGVNTADAKRRRMRSPVFLDGSFEFVPIKEDARFAEAEQIPTYNEVPSWKDRTTPLANYLPEGVRHYRTHADPEFETFTYGDIPSPRAANLAQVAPGDQLWFLARLWNHDDARWTGGSDFYFIAFIEVERNHSFPADTDPEDIEPGLRKRIQNNAHYRRILAGDRSAFRILYGDRRGSCRLDRALRLTPEVAGLLFGGSYDKVRGVFRSGGELLRNKNGTPRRFDRLGSITRAIQWFLDSGHPKQRLCMEALKRAATGDAHTKS